MSEIIEVNILDYTLSELQLDNLASEFYGQSLSIVGVDSDVQYSFEVASHAEGFIGALDGCFLRKNNN